MRRASLPHRLARLGERCHAGDRERAVRELAAETGLHLAEIQAELDAITEWTRRYGPETAARVIARYAEELRLPEAEVWTEYGRITGTAEARG